MNMIDQFFFHLDPVMAGVDARHPAGVEHDQGLPPVDPALPQHLQERIRVPDENTSASFSVLNSVQSCPSAGMDTMLPAFLFPHPIQ